MDEKSLEIIVMIAQESMRQEQTRFETVTSKANSLMGYVLTTIGVVNTMAVFLLDRNFFDINLLLWFVLLVDIPFGICLVSATIAQIMMKGKFFPTGIGALNDFRKVEKNMTFYNYEIYRLKCMHNYTEQLCKVNNFKAKMVSFSYGFYLFGLLMMFLTVIITLR